MESSVWITWLPSSLGLSLPASAESCASCPRRRGRCTKCWMRQHFTAAPLFSYTLLFLAAFRLQRICDIYSKVLGTEEALHVGLHADPCATVAPVLTESCFWNSVFFCVSASALWGKELVWGGVLWGLLHNLLPPGNHDTVWEVNLSLSLTWPQANSTITKSVFWSHWSLAVNYASVSCSARFQRAQGAEAAFRQVVLCRHRDGHRVERLHGGCGAGWRASSQRGQATAQHNRPYLSHLSDLCSYTVDATVLVNAARLLIGPLCHGQTPLQSDLANGAWVSGRAVLCVCFGNEFGFYIGDAWPHSVLSLLPAGGPCVSFSHHLFGEKPALGRRSPEVHWGLHRPVRCCSSRPDGLQEGPYCFTQIDHNLQANLNVNMAHAVMLGTHHHSNKVISLTTCLLWKMLRRGIQSSIINLTREGHWTKC